MKRYRCLWYKSTANHNILYLIHIMGISIEVWPENCCKTSAFLWKSRSEIQNHPLKESS